MGSYYEFNVSRNGRHIFATAPHSFPSYDTEKARSFYNELVTRFPKEEGFQVDVTLWESFGHQMIMEGK